MPSSHRYAARQAAHAFHSGILVVTLLLLAGLTITAAPADAETARVQDIPPSYTQVAENDAFRFYVDSSTLAFKLLDKRSGYLWHSGIDETIEGDRLNTSWRAFAQSGISIEYLDNRAINRRVSIANTAHTLDVAPLEHGVSAQLTFQDYGISIRIILQLEDDGVRVEVPFETVREENPDFRLGRLYLYPFLGATRGGSVPGYMLLPDGTGSLIRFADETKARTMYYGRYYGADLGMTAVMPWNPDVINPQAISYPVFGVAHTDSQSAFLSVVEQGAAYGEVQVHPAGITTNFNFIHHAFIYSETYFQATNRSGAGVTTIQRDPNRFDAVVHYRFLSGDQADYVGMAHSYQRFLIEHGQLRTNTFDNPDIGIRLEFLGGDKEKILLWFRFVPMTTVSQMRDILDSLALPNPEVIYYGWQPYGASSMPPTSITLEGGLGSLDELAALTESVEAAGGNFSLYLDPQSALRDEPGYSSRFDLAMAITNVNLQGYVRYPNYYLHTQAIRDRYVPLANEVAAQLRAGLALDSIGWTLYGDYRERPPVSRETTIQEYQNLLAEPSLRLGFYRPNAYLFQHMQAYYDMPLGDNGYVYTSEAVPFLPIVLAGHVPYYGGALNFSSNRQEDLLRHVEYGVLPSFFVTQEATARLLNTSSFWIYTSSYAQWGEQIRETYAWLNALLAPVQGQSIVAHQQLATGVFATTYANGLQIVVNYTDRPFERDGVLVEARNAALVENSL